MAKLDGEIHLMFNFNAAEKAEEIYHLLSRKGEVLMKMDKHLLPTVLPWFGISLGPPG